MPHRRQSHAPSLYPHPEISDDPAVSDWADNPDGDDVPRRPRNTSYPSSSSVPSVASSSSARSQRIRIRGTIPYRDAPAPPDRSVTATPILPKPSRSPLTRYQSAFAQFTRKYRKDPAMPYEDYGEDPAQVIGSNWGQLEDSDDDDPTTKLWPLSGGSTMVHPVFDRFSGEGFTDDSPVVPQTDEERERLEWQTMLASVLEGDVLRMEKTRIASSNDESSSKTKKRSLDIWFGIRARLRGRTEEEERARVEERRVRTVPPILDDVLTFRVTYNADLPPGALPPLSPLEQVLALLDRLDTTESLYPDLKSMCAEYPTCGAPEFLERTAALNAYVRMVSTLRARIHSIQQWTGSETLDVYAPSPTHDHLLRPHMELQDDSSFVERVLKEDSLQRTFERAILVRSHMVIENARATVLLYSPLFQAMGLPRVENELVQLIAFPTRLMEATLKVRLDSSKKIMEPSVIVVDQMLDDFSLSIALACTIKSEYEEFMRQDDQGFWALPPCISQQFDTVLLEALRFLFKLIHWKLKTASRIYFKEVDLLEAQWELFSEVATVTEEGSLLVAEHVCSVTHRLMVRVTNLFENQLRLPVYKPSLDSRARQSPWNSRPKLERQNAVATLRERDRPMGEEQILDWFNGVLDSVRLRYRKLQRFGRVLTQRFTNAAEYNLANLPLEQFINALVQTDHLLVYCESYEEDGVYIIADTSLRDRPWLIHDILHRSFQPTHDYRRAQATETSGEEEDYDDGSTPYLLLITPADKFVWTGDVMVYDTPKVALELQQKRMRLIADGPQLRLARAKERVTEIIQSVQLAAEGSEYSTGEGGEGQSEPEDYCIIPVEAHNPRVDKQLRRISRATNRLAEAIIKSVHKVSEVLTGVNRRQELLANWYAFAAENGQAAQKHMDLPTRSKFNRDLMRLAISYVSFICDECDPTDRRTFRWAVNALEFATLRTRGGNILNLPGEDFNLLRSKVATCMTLLISHFDILGARSNLEASQREQERLSQIRQRQEDAQAQMDDDEAARATLPSYMDPLRVSNWAKDRSIRLNRDDTWLKRLREIDHYRAKVESEQRIAGKVVDEEKPEDKSLVFLASSSSNIAMRWQQGRLVGTGAFGSVYLGVNLDSGTLMAVKEIRFTDVTSLSTLYQNVKDELSVMEMLSHPNIVEYYGIEVHRDKVYIFEEYCQGGSLASLLEHGRIEDERIIQVYTLQMLEGLDYLHSRGIVHRDIKPDNILLDHMGVIKLVDFGAAKILGKKQQHSVVARTRATPNAAHNHHNGHPAAPPSGFPPGFAGNSLTGTPMYMSPEVIKNDRQGREGAMDIWSLGCVVLECATGRKPWSNLDNEWAIMFHIGVTTKHPPLPEPSQLSELGIDFIRRCLTIDPTTRPGAGELMEHPWILELCEEMIEYEEEDANSIATPSVTTSSTAPSENFERAIVARQAAKMEQKDAAMIKSESPPDITPDEPRNGVLS